MRCLGRFANANDVYIDGLSDPDRWLVIKSKKVAYVVCTGIFHVIRGVENGFNPTTNLKYKYKSYKFPRASELGVMQSTLAYTVAVLNEQFKDPADGIRYTPL